jgi:elongation factor Ts
MTKVSAADISKLRELTGAGMMDCKKALEESNGDTEAAQDWLRKKGIAKAAKREDREAKEGVVIAIDQCRPNPRCVLALNCETDFAARNEGFIAMTNKLLTSPSKTSLQRSKHCLALPFEGSGDHRRKSGRASGCHWRKNRIGRYEPLTGAQILTYNHSNNKRSVAVALNKSEN